MNKYVYSTQDFVEVEVSPVMYQNAKRRADEQGALRKSIMGGRSNIYGYLGEEIFHKLFPRAIRTNTNEFDFVLNGITIDVKSKRCKHMPRIDFECSLALVTKLQDVEAYFFCRVKEDCSVGWALGWMSSNAYKNGCKEMKKGDYDPSNKMTFLCDCLNRPISDLWTVASLNVVQAIERKRTA